MQHTDDNSLCKKSLAPSAEMIENLVDGARYGDLEDVQSALQHSVAVDSADTSGRTGLPYVQLLVLLIVEYPGVDA